MVTIALAKMAAGTPLKVNAICPGWVRTDMGGLEAPSSVQQAAAIVVRMAALPADGPNGGFFDADGQVAW